MEHTYAVIMAGGGGTRLWPVSRKESPKQLLPLLGKETLFQSTVQRLENLFPPERILVVTVEDQVREMRQQAPSIPEENYLVEPAPRGTASVVGRRHFEERDPRQDGNLPSVILFVTAPVTLSAARPFDVQAGNLVTWHYPLSITELIHSTGHPLSGVKLLFEVKSFGKKPTKDGQTLLLQGTIMDSGSSLARRCISKKSQAMSAPQRYFQYIRSWEG